MTQIAPGSPLARKIFSVALFQETQRRKSFRSNMTGPAPKQTAAEAKAKKGQSAAEYPFVLITDLTKSRGDTVSVDLFNIPSGYPIMGDETLAGKLMHLESSSMELRVNQYRGGIDPGGRMTQQRTVWDLRGIAKANMANWNNKVEDQLCLIHAAGARGYHDDREWNIPLASHPRFNDIVVNPVLPPTRNRRFFAGDATSVSDLDSTDILGLEDFDRLRLHLDEMPFPMQPVKINGDPQSEEAPLYVCYVTPAQWFQIETSSSPINWRQFLADAFARSRDFKHPLFMGGPGMWAGILIKKMTRPILFNAGDLVAEYDASDVIQQVAAAVRTHRALLFGAQAVAMAYAGHHASGHHFSWNEELEDHKNRIEFSTSIIGGKAKVRFKGSDGELTDFGVMTIDSHVPVVT